MTNSNTPVAHSQQYLDTPSTWLLVCATVALSYLVPSLVTVLISNLKTVWPLWPGCAILVTGLLLVRVSFWPVLVAASFVAFAVADLQAGVPLRSIAWFIPGNTVEVLISAVGLRYCFDGLPRLNSVRALAKYLFFGVVLAPFAGAFFSAYGIASDYWTGWKVVFLSEVLAFVTLTPALLSWVSEGRVLMRRPRAHHLEGVMLIAGLVVVSYIVFTLPEDSRSPALFYTLVPFLLWSAMRFGWVGVSTSLIAVTSLSIWGAVYGRGPFSNLVPLTNPLPLQMFLIFVAIPFLVLAALAEEHKQSLHVIGESEERLRLAAQAGRMFAYSWHAATNRIERSGESTEILGITEDQVTTGAAVSAMIHPDDRERVEVALARLSVDNPNLRITYRIVRPDGEIRWLERNSHAYFDKHRKMERIVGMIVDATERMRAEEALLGVNRRLIEAQEQERSRIGRELHDDINQRLAMLAVELEQLKENPSEVGIHVQELRKHVTDISNDVQALSHDLHSSQLEYLGVVAGMKSWCKEFAERQRMQIDCRPDVRSTLPLEIGLCLFRVLQEALHNAAKHSGVKRIEVQLQEASGELHLIVHDAGRGFDVETARQGRGLGLISMRERVRLVNGTIDIQSKPMGGTTIHARVPLTSEHGSQGVAV